jgi:phosphoribosylformimino-5-aminoimidazole carboxamide ribonucleotide (ProFAR) isomerase
VAVGLDFRVNEAGVAEAQAQGWLAGSGWSVNDLVTLWSDEPLGAVVVTQVERDGTLGGPNVDALSALLERTMLPLVASGGVGTTKHLVELAQLQRSGRRLAGAIVGKALVEGRFSVAEGIAACAASD